MGAPGFILAVCLRTAFGSSQLSCQLFLLLFLALKRVSVGFGYFVFTLGRVNTYSAFIKNWGFGDFEDMDLGGCYFWIWIYTRYVLLFSFQVGLEWLCEEIVTIGSRDILKLFCRIDFRFWNMYIILFTYLKVVIVANPKYSVCCPNVFHSLFCISLGVSW